MPFYIVYSVRLFLFFELAEIEERTSCFSPSISATGEMDRYYFIVGVTPVNVEQLSFKGRNVLMYLFFFF